MKFFDGKQCNWRQPHALPNMSWRCGFCGDRVSSVSGLKLGAHPDGSGPQVGGIYICTNCGGPTFFSPQDGVYPGEPFGNPVANVPGDLTALYEEARRCTGQNCYTAAVLLCRKILMNIAVAQGAEEGQRFVEYVNFLADAGYIPPNGRHWVDHIRRRGNEANHEVHLMMKTDAAELVAFTEMLLKLIYEFPSLIKPEDALS